MLSALEKAVSHIHIPLAYKAEFAQIVQSTKLGFSQKADVWP